jgi:hypothetical protein
MEVGHPATTSTTTTTSSVAQHPAYPNSFAPESAAEESVPENQLAEGNILDLPIPSVPRLEEATEPTRMQTMFPRNPGLGASRWAPRTTLDGRPIED